MKPSPVKITELLKRWGESVVGTIIRDYGLTPFTSNAALLAIITSAMLDELAEIAYQDGYHLDINGPTRLMDKGDPAWYIRIQHNVGSEGSAVNVAAPSKDEAVLKACEAMAKDKEAPDAKP